MVSEALGHPHQHQNQHLYGPERFICTTECIANIYGPQRNCGKVIFSQASVNHSVHRRGCVYPSMPLCADTPLPSACWNTPLPRWPLLRMVCIILECILVTVRDEVAKVMFYTCLSIHREGLPQCMLGYQALPTPRSRHPPPAGTPRPGTPRQSRHTHTPGADPLEQAHTPPPPQADGYCCGRYASYWNAFLLHFVFTVRQWYICAIGKFSAIFLSIVPKGLFAPKNEL